VSACPGADLNMEAEYSPELWYLLYRLHNVNPYDHSKNIHWRENFVYIPLSLGLPFSIQYEYIYNTSVLRMLPCTALFGIHIAL
jgi:hypothetical protein